MGKQEMPEEMDGAENVEKVAKNMLDASPDSVARTPKEEDEERKSRLQGDSWREQP
jgi:hypothetical protein